MLATSSLRKPGPGKARIIDARIGQVIGETFHLIPCVTNRITS
jgi:hypothetical protein